MTQSEPRVNEEIRDTLIENGIVTHPRTKNCGQWVNLPPQRGSDFKRPLRVSCGRYECRSCRNTIIGNIQESHFIENQILQDRGGSVLLMTLTVPHRRSESFSSLYPRFKRSLQEMKKGRGWKQIKRETEYQYHYDTIEHHETPNGHHIHNHITFGCMEPKVPLETIKDHLFNTWSHYTSRNGFPKVSRKGIDVTPTNLSSHSESWDTKTIEELTKIYGTTEYWESEYHKCMTLEEYRNPSKTPEEIKKELITRNQVTSKTRRGKIQRKQTLPLLSEKDKNTNVLLDSKGNAFSINDLSRGYLYEEDRPFPLKENSYHLDHLRRNYRRGYYCQLTKTRNGNIGYKWKKDVHGIYS